MPPRYLPPLLFLSALLACSSSPPPIALRDSLGITLIDMNPAAGPRVPEMGLAPLPALTIDGREGSSDSLGFSRIYGALLLSDGSIVALEGTLLQVRFYRPDGTASTVVGREGSGPGEFRMPVRLLQFPGDSVAVLDHALQRVTVFSKEGRLGRVFRVVPHLAEGFHNPWGVYEDGSLAVVTIARRPEPPLGGVIHTERVLMRYDGEGGYIAELARVPQAPRFELVPDESYFLPYTVSPSYVALGRATVVARGPQFALELLDSTGALRRVLRLAMVPAAPTSADREAFEADFLAGADAEEAPRLEQWLRDAPWPGRLAAVDRVLAAPSGRLWLRRFNPRPEAEQRWLILDTLGSIRAWVSVPAGLELQAVRDTQVLAIARDSLDLPSLTIMRLLECDTCFHAAP